MDYGQSCYKLLICLLQAEMQGHCLYCMNQAMFFSLPGEIPASEASQQMKHKTTVCVHIHSLY